jgi:hypothetical protein
MGFWVCIDENRIAVLRFYVFNINLALLKLPLHFTSISPQLFERLLSLTYGISLTAGITSNDLSEQ